MQLKQTGALVALYLSTATLSQAADLECMKAFLGNSNYPNSEVSVRRPTTKLAYRNDLSRNQLTRLATGEIHVEHGSQLNGLTVAHMTSSVGTNLSVLRKVNGTTCVWPSKVQVSVGYEKMEVFVVSEYRPSTCQYSVTMQHEKEHVKINKETLASHLPRLVRVVKRKIAKEYPKKVPAGWKPSDFVVQDLSGLVDKHVEGMTDERDARHGHLDSPRSYAYWQSLCPSW